MEVNEGLVIFRQKLYNIEFVYHLHFSFTYEIVSSQISILFAVQIQLWYRWYRTDNCNPGNAGNSGFCSHREMLVQKAPLHTQRNAKLKTNKF